MQKSPPTPSATSWSSRARSVRFGPYERRGGGWLCAGESCRAPRATPALTRRCARSERAELTIYIVEDSEAVKERLIESVEDIPHARVVGSADAVRRRSKACARCSRAC